MHLRNLTLHACRRKPALLVRVAGSRHRVGAYLLAAIMLPLAASAAIGAQPASTSRQAREDAIRSLPLGRLDAAERQKIVAVVNDCVFRRLPTQVLRCDPDFYAFMIDHPDVIVNIWSVLGISEVKLRRTGEETFDADDGAGAVGKVEFLYRSHDTHLLYGEGTYEGRLFSKPVRGRCVMLLKTSYLRETDGKYYITCRLDAFMQLDNVGVEILAKTFQPMIGPIADHNFRETAHFVESLFRAAEINYTGMQELARKLKLVTPETRQEFAAATEEVAVKAALAETPVAERPARAATARRNPAGTQPR